MHYSAGLQYCLVTYLLAQIFYCLVVLKNCHSMMITERFCHCDCWRMNDNWTDTQSWIYLIFCILWILHPVWESGGFLWLRHLRIIKSNFSWIFVFSSVKSIQTNSSRLNHRKKLMESPKNKAKQFVPAPKERSKHAISRNFFWHLTKKRSNSVMQIT